MISVRITKGPAEIAKGDSVVFGGNDLRNYGISITAADPSDQHAGGVLFSGELKEIPKEFKDESTAPMTAEGIYFPQGNSSNQDFGQLTIRA